jgi:hypothetical protein
MLEEEGHIRVYDDEFMQRLLGQPGTMAAMFFCEWQQRGRQHVRAFHRLAATLGDRVRFVVLDMDKNPMTVITLGFKTSVNILIIHEGAIIAHEDFQLGVKPRKLRI